MFLFFNTVSHMIWRIEGMLGLFLHIYGNLLITSIVFSLPALSLIKENALSQSENESVYAFTSGFHERRASENSASCFSGVYSRQEKNMWLVFAKFSQRFSFTYSSSVI